MRVIVKSNEFIAIPTKRKSECIFLLGQYLNKKTCKVELCDNEVKRIICTKKPDSNSWSKTVTLEADLSYNDRYIILDLEGNLVDVVTKEQFENQYAVLEEGE